MRDLPIVDWHNHLDIEALAADAPLGSLYEVWVAPAPYKHCAMRICGESAGVQHPCLLIERDAMPNAKNSVGGKQLRVGSGRDRGGAVGGG